MVHFATSASALVAVLLCIAQLPLSEPLRWQIWPRASRSLQQSSQADALAACLPSSCPDTERTKWAYLREDKPSCIKLHKAFWSATEAKVPVTLVTQLSADRLPQLKAQCTAWSGPLAAVVYVPLLNAPAKVSEQNIQRLQAATAAVEQLFKVSEQQQRCQLRMAVMVEVFDSEQALAGLYPVNTLRNYARLLADTPMVANIDVDMMPSASLSAVLQRPGFVDGLLAGSGRKAVYVIPAFETYCGGPSFADNVAVRNREQLQQAVADKCVGQFRGKVAPECHNATDYQRWFSLKDGTTTADQAYPVQYQDSFEPWYVSDRMSTLWFDVRYRGYGKNKIVQSAAMHAAGFEFRVMPEGFLVHRYHTQSKARIAFLRVKFKSRKQAQLLKNSLYEHVEQLWNRTVVEMGQGTYRPTTDPALDPCLSALPWWRPDGVGQG